jgi:hypothetical protein
MWKQLTGEPVAGTLHSGFGGRGWLSPFPTPIHRPLVDLRIREKRTFADLAERPKAVAARVAGAGVGGSSPVFITWKSWCSGSGRSCESFVPTKSGWRHTTHVVSSSIRSTRAWRGEYLGTCTLAAGLTYVAQLQSSRLPASLRKCFRGRQTSIASSPARRSGRRHRRIATRLGRARMSCGCWRKSAADHNGRAKVTERSAWRAETIDLEIARQGYSMSQSQGGFDAKT